MRSASSFERKLCRMRTLGEAESTSTVIGGWLSPNNELRVFSGREVTGGGSSYSAIRGLTSRWEGIESGATPLALPRLQQSTWTFEGTVRPEGEQRGGADESDAWDEWQVVDVEWQVWEVQEPANARKTAQEQFPTHGGSA